MSKRSPSTSARRPARRSPPGRTAGAMVETLLLVMLLAMTVARTALNEPPYRRAPLTEAGAYVGVPIAQQMFVPVQALRVAHAAIILALAAAWAIARAVRAERPALRHPLFGLGVVLLAGALLASAAGAADKREAFSTAVEQISLAAAAFLMMQLARAAWQRRLVLIVVVAVGVMLGAKALYQRYVELPQHIADFEANKSERLASVGHETGSPTAQMFETRLREGTAKGWFSLANVFGSLALLTGLTGVGLAADRWLGTGRRLDRKPESRASGEPMEVPLPVLAATTATLLALPCVAAWLLTDSTGAILSGLAAGGVALAIVLAGPWAAQHRRTLLLAAGGVFVAAATALVGVGISQGGLPSQTLQVRWEYWSASAEMTADRPAMGVGPGNFAYTYLRYRHAGAEEEVKNPHNLIVQAAAEYGLVGAAAYLGVLGFLLLKLCAPREPDEPNAPAQPVSTRNIAGLLAAIAAGAVGWRIGVSHYPSLAHLIYDNFVPALALAVALPACCWTGKSLADGLASPGRIAPVALACGLGGFALHNLSDFALFQPGAAMVFWVAAGAVLAGRRGRRWNSGRPGAAAIAVVLATATVLTAGGVLAPVWRRTNRARSAAAAYIAGDLDGAIARMAEAADADHADARASDDLMRLLWRRARQRTGAAARADIQDALTAAQEACRRNPARPAFAESLARAQAYAMDPSLLQAEWIPVLGDQKTQRKQASDWLARRPRNPYRLSLSAHYAYRAGEMTEAAELLERARDATGDTWPILLDHLGNVKHAQGNAIEARDYWDRFIRHRGTQSSQWRDLATSTTALLNEMNRQDPRLHLRLAGLAWQMGCPDLTRAEIAAAQATDAALTDQSILHFTEAEIRQLALLAAKSQSPAPQGSTMPPPGQP